MRPAGATLGRWIGWAATCLALGCNVLRNPSTPMAWLDLRQPTRPGSHLALFLPGLGDTPQNVVRGGVIAEMAEAPQFDCIVADAHYGYYRAGTLTERLHDDVVGKLRERYDEFWIIGTSMGGYGAVAYAEKFPGAVTGLVLLAPYLGQDEVLKDIEQAGSVEKWDPRGLTTQSDRTAHGIAVWRWLKERPEHRGDPVLVLASGDDDKLKRGIRLLEPVVSPELVYQVPGGHNWTTWRELFHRVVQDVLSAR